MKPYFNPTRQNMEDDLIIFFRWRTTLISFNGRQPHLMNLIKMEDDLNIIANGRQN